MAEILKDENPRKDLYRMLLADKTPGVADKIKKYSFNQFEKHLLSNEDAQNELGWYLEKKGVVSDPTDFSQRYIQAPQTPPAPKPQAAPVAPAPIEQEPYVPEPQPAIGSPEYDAQLQAQYQGMTPTLGATFGGVPAAFETKAQKKQEQISPAFKAQKLAFEDVPIAEEQRRAQRQFAKSMKGQQQIEQKQPKGFFEDLGTQLKRGLAQGEAIQSVNMEQLRDAARGKNLEAIPYEQIAAANKAVKEFGQTQSDIDLAKKEGIIKDAWDVVKALPGVTIESLASLGRSGLEEALVGAGTGAAAGSVIPGLGTAAGGGLGAAAGMVQAGRNMEYFGTLMQELEAKGVDITDPAKLKYGIATYGKDADKTAITRANTIAAVESLLPIAGKGAEALAARVGSKVAQKPLQAAGKALTYEPIAGPLGGATGELAAQIASGQEIDPQAIALEAGGEGAATVAAITKAIKSRKKPSVEPSITPEAEAIPAEEVQGTGRRAFADSLEEVPAEYRDRVVEVTTGPLSRFGVGKKQYSYVIPAETIEVAPETPVSETAPIIEEAPVAEETIPVAPETEQDYSFLEEMELTPEERAALLAQEEATPVAPMEEAAPVAPAEEEGLQPGERRIGGAIVKTGYAPTLAIRPSQQAVEQQPAAPPPPAPTGIPVPFTPSVSFGDIKLSPQKHIGETIAVEHNGEQKDYTITKVGTDYVLVTDENGDRISIPLYEWSRNVNEPSAPAEPIAPQAAPEVVAAAPVEEAAPETPAAPAPKGRKKKEAPVTPAPAAPKKEEGEVQQEPRAAQKIAAISPTNLQVFKGVVTKDPLKPKMQGVYFDKANQKIVATDGMNMVVIDRDVKSDVVINPKTGEVIKEPFPDYQTVIPTDYTKGVRNVSINDLLGKLDAIIKGDKERTENAFATITFDGEQVGITPKVLKAGLKALKDLGYETASIEYEAPNKPLLIKTKDGKTLLLTMPTFLREDKAEGAISIGEFTLEDTGKPKAEPTPAAETKEGKKAEAKEEKVTTPEFTSSQSSEASPQAGRAVGGEVELNEGDKVGVRLNLNIRKSTGENVLSVHNKSFRGKVLGYFKSMTLKNVKFNVNENAAEKIASGESNKFSMASVDGEYVKTNKHSTDGTEIFFNPKKNKSFVDKDGYAVVSADEVSVIGNKIYAKGVKYADNENFGYHGGTLKEKSDYLTQGYRGEQPFTGHYFFSDRERAEGRGDRSKLNNNDVGVVDFSKYNLLKPTTNEYWAVKSGLKRFEDNFLRNGIDDAFESLDVYGGLKYGYPKIYEEILANKDKVKKAAQEWKDNELENIDDKKKIERLETVILKTLGYEGVDVRGLKEEGGDASPDSSSEGSVIFDLKPESIKEQPKAVEQSLKEGKTQAPAPSFTSEQSSEAATAFDKAKTSKGFDKKYGKGAYKALSDITKNFEDIMDKVSEKIKQDCIV